MNLLALAIGMALDALFGEPKWLWDRVPHPAVLIGRGIAYADKRFNVDPNQKFNGIALIVVLVTAAWAIGTAVSWIGLIAEALVVAVMLAHKSLVEHVEAVAEALRRSEADGRNAVAMIVGRDTSGMDATAVTRAAIESAAENFSDAVMAPLFWTLIAGIPGLLIYKAVNTADSMIGYMTPRHKEFGWAAARLDDVLNWVPARVTAFMILVLYKRTRRWSDVATDARLHRSPNAGWPEAAIARVQNLALAGPRSYEGTMRDFPFVHVRGRRKVGPDDIDTTCRVLWRAWWSVYVPVALLGMVTALP